MKTRERGREGVFLPHRWESAAAIVPDCLAEHGMVDQFENGTVDGVGGFEFWRCLPLALALPFVVGNVPRFAS